MTAASQIVAIIRQLDLANEGIVTWDDLRSLLSGVLRRISSSSVDDDDLDTLFEAGRHIFGESAVPYEDFIWWLCDPDLGHANRSLSVQYFSTSLLREVSDVGLGRDAKIYEMEPGVIRKKGERMFCPRDGRKGAAYVDCVFGQDSVGLADTMLSYTWGYTIGDIVDTLVEYCKTYNYEYERCHVWMCWSCINQHRVKERQNTGEKVPFEEFQQAFGDRVKSIGKVMAMVSPWRAPIYITRVWCNFELYMAKDTKQELVLVMPPAEFKDFQCTILSGSRSAGWAQNMWNVLSKIQVQNAEASVKEDKDQILKLIREGDGYTNVNSAISELIQNWMVDTSVSHLKASFASGDASDVDMLDLFESVGQLLLQLDRADEALWAFENAKLLRQKLGVLDTSDGAELYRNTGIILNKKKRLEEGLQALEKAKELREKLGSLEADDGARLLMSLAISYRSLGRLDNALATLQKAKEIHSHLNSWETTMGANAVNSTGVVKAMKGDHTGALECYMEALDIRTKIDRMRNPEGVKLLTNLGRVLCELGEHEKGLEHYGEARTLLEATATKDTPYGKELVQLHDAARDAWCVPPEGGLLRFDPANEHVLKAQKLLQDSREGGSVYSALQAARELRKPPATPAAARASRLQFFYSNFEPDGIFAIAQLWQSRASRGELQRTPLVVHYADLKWKDSGTSHEKKMLMAGLLLGVYDAADELPTESTPLHVLTCEGDSESSVLAQRRHQTLKRICAELAAFDGELIELFVMAPGCGNIGALIEQLKADGQWPVKARWKVSCYTGAYNMKGMVQADLDAIGELMQCSDCPMIDLAKFPFFGGDDCHPSTSSMATFVARGFGRSLTEKHPVAAAVLKSYMDETNHALIGPDSSVLKGAVLDAEAQERYGEICRVLREERARTGGDGDATRTHANALRRDSVLWRKVVPFKRSTVDALALGMSDAPLCVQLLFLHEWLIENEPSWLADESPGRWCLDSSTGFTRIDPEASGGILAVQPTLRNPKCVRSLGAMKEALQTFTLRYVDSVSQVVP